MIYLKEERKSMKNPDKESLGFITKQFEALRRRIEGLEKEIKELRKGYEDNLEIEEGCPDEIEGNLAAYNMVQEICLGSLLDIEPKGEA